MDSARKHCYVEALQAAKRASEKKGAGLEQTLRMAQLRWDRRERSLLAQVAALQSEAKLFALAYQQRLQGYLLHISSIAEEIGRYCEVGIKLRKKYGLILVIALFIYLHKKQN